MAEDSEVIAIEYSDSEDEDNYSSQPAQPVQPAIVLQQQTIPHPITIGDNFEQKDEDDMDMSDDDRSSFFQIDYAPLAYPNSSHITTSTPIQKYGYPFHNSSTPLAPSNGAVEQFFPARQLSPEYPKFVQPAPTIFQPILQRTNNSEMLSKHPSKIVEPSPQATLAVTKKLSLPVTNGNRTSAFLEPSTSILSNGSVKPPIAYSETIRERVVQPPPIHHMRTDIIQGVRTNPRERWTEYFVVDRDKKWRKESDIRSLYAAAIKQFDEVQYNRRQAWRNRYSFEATICDVCTETTTDPNDIIIQCQQCHVYVHQHCYGELRIPKEDWKCKWCREHPGSKAQPSCKYCISNTGAFIPIQKSKQWAHAACALWIPNVYARDEISGAICFVYDDSGVAEERWKWKCGICKSNEGAIIQCERDSCMGWKCAVHVLCARNTGLPTRRAVVPSWSHEDDMEKVGFYAYYTYCRRHQADKFDPIAWAKKARDNYDASMDNVEVSESDEDSDNSSPGDEEMSPDYESSSDSDVLSESSEESDENATLNRPWTSAPKRPSPSVLSSTKEPQPKKARLLPEVRHVESYHKPIRISNAAETPPPQPSDSVPSSSSQPTRRIPKKAPPTQSILSRREMELARPSTSQAASDKDKSNVESKKSTAAPVRPIAHSTPITQQEKDDALAEYECIAAMDLMNIKEGTFQGQFLLLRQFFPFFLDNTESMEKKPVKSAEFIKFEKLFLKNKGTTLLWQWLNKVWFQAKNIFPTNNSQVDSSTIDLLNTVLPILEHDFPPPRPAPSPANAPSLFGSSFLSSLMPPQQSINLPPSEECNDFTHLHPDSDKIEPKTALYDLSRSVTLDLLKANLEIIFGLMQLTKLDFSASVKHIIKVIAQTIMKFSTTSLGLPTEFDLKLQGICAKAYEILNKQETPPKSKAPISSAANRPPAHSQKPVIDSMKSQTKPLDAVAAQYNQFRNNRFSAKPSEDYSSLPELEKPSGDQDGSPIPPSGGAAPSKCSHSRRVHWKPDADLVELHTFEPVKHREGREPEAWQNIASRKEAKRLAARERLEQARADSMSDESIPPTAPEVNMTEEYLRSQTNATREQLQPSTLEGSTLVQHSSSSGHRRRASFPDARI